MTLSATVWLNDGYTTAPHNISGGTSRYVDSGEMDWKRYRFAMTEVSANNREYAITYGDGTVTGDTALRAADT